MAPCVANAIHCIVCQANAFEHLVWLSVRCDRKHSKNPWCPILPHCHDDDYYRIRVNCCRDQYLTCSHDPTNDFHPMNYDWRPSFAICDYYLRSLVAIWSFSYHYRQRLALHHFHHLVCHMLRRHWNARWRARIPFSKSVLALPLVGLNSN